MKLTYNDGVGLNVGDVDGRLDWEENVDDYKDMRGKYDDKFCRKDIICGNVSYPPLDPNLVQVIVLYG